MNEEMDQKSYFIPYEVVTIILGHMLPYRTIMQCRLVCRAWNHSIEHESWKYVVKLEESRGKTYSDANIEKISQLPWYILHSMCAKDGLFGRAFVMTKNRGGSPYWKFNLDSPSLQTFNKHDPPNPENFLTGKIQVGKLQHSAKAAQIIKLPKCGLQNLLLRIMRPEISVWLRVRADAGLESSTDGPKYHVLVYLRNSALQVINESSIDKPNLLRNVMKGAWKRAKLTKQRPSESKPGMIDSILIEHLLYNSEAKCTFSHIIIRIEKPSFSNYLSVDWNSIINGDPPYTKPNTYESIMFPEYCSYFNKKLPTSRWLRSSNLLPNFEQYHDLLAFPESGVLIPGAWYGRPLADVIKAKDDDVDASTCYENENYLLFYELKCKIRLREHGLFPFIMDNLQPYIEASVDYNKIHRDKMKYEMIVSLLDDNESILHQKEASEIISKLDWKKLLKLSFEKYGQGVTYIVFTIRRHMSMNKCIQVVHGPTTTTFLNHVKSVINSCELQITSTRPYSDY